MTEDLATLERRAADRAGLDLVVDRAEPLADCRGPG